MSEIRIYNPKSKHEILIDSSKSGVIFHPRTYEEHPYVEIKILNGFDLIRHSIKCKDCGEFVKSLGTDILDWYLEFGDKTHRLNLQNLGSDTKLKFINSSYEYGTVLQLRVHDIPVDMESLIILRDELVAQQNYEKACVIRDLINTTQD